MGKSESQKLFTNNEIISFCSQLSMMLSAGITVMEGLRLIQEDTRSKEGKEVLSEILSHFDQGSNFYQAVSAAGVFPDYALQMIYIGEQTGNLDAVMGSLADYYEREESIAQGIAAAVTYPFIMIGMMLVVILVLITRVLPIFEQVFQQLGTSMTGLSASILNMGKVIGRYSVLFVCIFAFFVLLYIVLTRSRKGKQALRDFACGFFATRSLYEAIAAGRFSSGMSLALSSGFSIESGLEMTMSLVQNKLYRIKLQHCTEYLQAGDSFADALMKSNIFTGTYGRMAVIGFRSGKLDEVMKKLSRQYAQEVDYKINHFVSILEPTLVAVLSIVVGMILLSVMLPLMGIMSSIG